MCKMKYYINSTGFPAAFFVCYRDNDVPHKPSAPVIFGVHVTAVYSGKLSERPGQKRKK